MSYEMTFSDLGRVHWASTLKLAVGRAFFAGMVVSILMLVMSSGGPAPTGGEVLAMPFVWAIIGPVFSLGMWLVGRVLGFIADMFGDTVVALAFSLPAAALLFMASILMCAGDPIVYFLNRSFPNLFNVADFRFFNFRPMIFVTFPD